MPGRQTFKTVSEYLDNERGVTKQRLLALRAIVRETLPKATELINYGIPAYALVKDGKRDKQVMIAGYRAFVGLYPGPDVLEHFANELAGYTVGKGSVQFPHDKPLPKALIVKILRHRMKQLA